MKQSENDENIEHLGSENQGSEAALEVSRRDFLQGCGTLGLGAWLLPSLKNGEEAQRTFAWEDGYEYAAGAVVLPFSYTAELSPALKPEGLDFVHQLNPDNCQVFVRIDDELWEFRSQWIINLGTAARYHGPDIDHMTRAEDAVYPAGMTSCWFLGGMWYDESERKLYAPMHIEHDGPRRAYPFGRKIALSTSMDKGRTWKYEGDIISSETYYYPHDFFKFSGSSFGNGLADFGFYVDVRGGYFYIFPDEGWAPYSTRGARWNSRAARCAIRDKMAPGKWHLFYNGTWTEPALGGRSSIVAPSHLWGVTYSSAVNQYICMFLGNQDPPVDGNVDGVYIGCCSDLSKQDWKWVHCPEGKLGFINLISADGRDVPSVCRDSYRFYSYFAKGEFQRLDIRISPGETTGVDLQHRYLFERHPESSDAMLARETKLVGCASAEMKYTGKWTARAAADSYEGKVQETSSPNSAVEFSFDGTDIYWRAVHSPDSGRADIYIDGAFRKQVDCYSPLSTSYEQFLYVKRGLAAGVRHTIKVVASGKKHPRSAGASIGHVGFEFSAESYKASAGFSALMGKNNWYYQQLIGGGETDLVFVADEAHPRRYWSGSGDSRIGGDFQCAQEGTLIRRWVAPHGGVIRIEGVATGDGESSAKILINSETLWSSDDLASATAQSHDLTLTLIQGDNIDFTVSRKQQSKDRRSPEAAKVSWDPVITYLKSVAADWQPNLASNRNLALNTYARSKVLVSHYCPFNAVDGDLNTSFTLHADDRFSVGDDWVELDLEKVYLIDHYVVSSQTADPDYRPATFTLQRSEDGLGWSDVDTASLKTPPLEHYYGIPMTKVARGVAPFRARHVRLYLPKGKPFTITEFQLYYTEGKTSFAPPQPAG